MKFVKNSKIIGQTVGIYEKDGVRYFKAKEMCEVFCLGKGYQSSSIMVKSVSPENKTKAPGWSRIWTWYLTDTGVMELMLASQWKEGTKRAIANETGTSLMDGMLHDN